MSIFVGICAEIPGRYPGVITRGDDCKISGRFLEKLLWEFSWAIPSNPIVGGRFGKLLKNLRGGISMWIVGGSVKKILQE